MQLTAFLVATALLGNAYSLMAQQAQAPPAVRVERRVMPMSYRNTIPDNAVIYDDSTGKRMTLKEFAELNRADPRGHRLIPAYNEYGKPDHYRYRQVTREERETSRFIDRDPSLAPKAGQLMPLFVMQGTDGKTYRMADLAGKNIVLSFWITFQPPYTNQKTIESLAKQIDPFRQTAELISLGVTNDSPEQLVNFLGAQPVPFVPVADGRGFAEKYHLTSFPTVIVIDKTGRVVASLSGPDVASVGDTLKKLN